MRAAPYPPQQGHYSQRYQFYYTSTGRYCAYDVISGTHLIHSLKTNRWYPYLPDIYLPSQTYSQQNPRPSNRTNEYQRHGYDHQPSGVHRSGAVGGVYANGGQFQGGERNREPVFRNHTEGFLYSAAATDAAQRSLIEESVDGMHNPFDDEGVDVRMGERVGRPRKSSNERQRQRSRSGPELRSQDSPYRGPPYTQEAGYSQRSLRQPNYQTDHNANRSSYNRLNLKQNQGHTFGSNQAGVGCEGSEHDSGYKDENEPVPYFRRSMPGVARWLDDTPSVYSAEDGQHPFDVEIGRMQCDSEQHSRRARGGVNYDQPRDRYHRSKPRTSSHPIHTDFGTSRNNQSFHQEEKRTASRDNENHRAPWSSQKTLHRQDSGIDMSVAMVDEVNIEIDVHTTDARDGEIYPDPHVECYYTIPPCPNLPPPQETITGTTQIVYVSGGQELAVSHHHQNKTVSTTFRQPDSVCTESIILTPRPEHHQYESYSYPTMLPRAPSPPLSPAPIHTQRTRRSGLGVPVVEYDRWG